MNKRYWYGLLALVCSTLACQPVIAIGKNELLCLLVLIVVLLGPPIYKFARRMETILRSREKDKTQHDK